MTANGDTHEEDRPALQAVDDQGRPVDLAVLEDAGVAYDPTRMHLDLDKNEKRRTTALMMAIQAYSHLIIREAEMYKALRKDQREIHPATIDAMVLAAISFDRLIAGKFDDLVPMPGPPQSPDSPTPPNPPNPEQEPEDATA